MSAQLAYVAGMDLQVYFALFAPRAGVGDICGRRTKLTQGPGVVPAITLIIPIDKPSHCCPL